MKQTDLKFWTEVTGKKPHLIFRQDDTFYILTSQQDCTRGNFQAISRTEVDRVKKQLADSKVPSLFHCDNIYRLISCLAVELDRNKPEYYISRLRNICYILVASGSLSIEKDGNSILFRKRSALVDPFVQSPRKTVLQLSQKTKIQPQKIKSQPQKTKIQSKPGQTICPYCKSPVGEKRLEAHKQEKCPKRPNL